MDSTSLKVTPSVGPFLLIISKSCVHVNTSPIKDEWLVLVVCMAVSILKIFDSL